MRTKITALILGILCALPCALRAEEDVTITSVTITSVFGDVMLTTIAQSGEWIDISALSRGNYILSVVADGQRYSRRFIKMR